MTIIINRWLPRNPQQSGVLFDVPGQKPIGQIMSLYVAHTPEQASHIRREIEGWQIDHKEVVQELLDSLSFPEPRMGVVYAHMPMVRNGAMSKELGVFVVIPRFDDRHDVDLLNLAGSIAHTLSQGLLLAADDSFPGVKEQLQEKILQVIQWRLGCINLTQEDFGPVVETEVTK